MSFTLALITLCALLHMVGAILGALYNTFAEVFYIKAASDGNIDAHERKYLRRLFRGLHAGVIIILFASIALIVLEYLVPDAPQAVLTGPFWAVQTITLAMLLFGYELSKRAAPWWLASAAMLAGWWMLVAIDAGLFNTLGYIPILVIYAIALLVLAGIVGYVRMWIGQPKK